MCTQRRGRSQKRTCAGLALGPSSWGGHFHTRTDKVVHSRNSRVCCVITKVDFRRVWPSGSRGKDKHPSHAAYSDDWTTSEDTPHGKERSHALLCVCAEVSGCTWRLYACVLAWWCLCLYLSLSFPLPLFPFYLLLLRSIAPSVSLPQQQQQCLFILGVPSRVS